jgi:hypothetical protein
MVPPKISDWQKLKLMKKKVWTKLMTAMSSVLELSITDPSHSKDSGLATVTTITEDTMIPL